MAIYMNYNKLAIKGNVTAAGYENWIELDSMQVMTQRAVALAERGKPFAREAYLARVICGEKAMEIGTNGVQLLGGHGFTKEHPVERWYRDLRAIALMEGGLHL